VIINKSHTYTRIRDKIIPNKEKGMILKMNEKTMIDSTLSVEKTNHVVSIISDDQYIEYPDNRTPEQKRHDYNLEHDYSVYPG